MNGILVVAATKSEAAHVPKRFETVITDIGKVAAAVAVTEALAAYPRDARPQPAAQAPRQQEPATSRSGAREDAGGR